MDYVSIRFLVFLAVSLAVYYLIPRKRQPHWLLLCSLFFYVSADPRYLLFLLFTAASTFFAARRLPKTGRKRLLLLLVLVLNLGLMAALKLLLFRPEAWERLAGAAGRFRLLYPLGMSFYTLQSVGYLLDVYRGRIAPEESFSRYCLFLSFFLIIVQGPISRYEQLSPQLCRPHEPDYRSLSFGAQLALWGFFKKLVIADRANLLVRSVYGTAGEAGSLAVTLAVFLYTFQLYADFSGCVDICRGIGQMFGIDLAENFHRPFFSLSIREFWRRWHLSLSTWLRDYLYIPLGGSRRGSFRKALNLILVFLVSGFWHGSGLNYLFWGLLHGFYQVVGDLTRGPRDRFWQRLGLQEAPRFLRRLGCWLLVCFAFHFFRAPGMRAALQMLRIAAEGFPLSALTDGSVFLYGLDRPDMLVLTFALGLLLAVSLWQEKHDGLLVRDRIAAAPAALRWLIWLVGLLAVLIFGIYGPGYNRAEFIYMNF